MSPMNATAMRRTSQPGVRGGFGEPVAGQRRHHHVEGVLRPTAERRRIGEARDHVEELDDRARPAVGEQQRQGALVGRPGVDEVDRLPVDRGR